MARIVYSMSRTDFLNFRERAVAGLLEATFYEYLYLGISIDEAEVVKPSLKSALEDWWDSEHVYADAAVNSQLARAVKKSSAGRFEETIDARSKMNVDGLPSSLPCSPNRRDVRQKRPVRSTGYPQRALTGAGADSRKRR